MKIYGVTYRLGSRHANPRPFLAAALEEPSNCLTARHALLCFPGLLPLSPLIFAGVRRCGSAPQAVPGSGLDQQADARANDPWTMLSTWARSRFYSAQLHPSTEPSCTWLPGT